MPFQVSLHVSTHVVSPITITVGDNLTAPCTDSIDLVATITIGYENRHVYLWELASGDPVVFTTPVNQLTATCTFLGLNTDRVFYFWVDKGRPSQQQFIVHYWTNPTETTPVVASNVLAPTDLVYFTITSTDLITANTINGELMENTPFTSMNTMLPIIDLVDYNLTHPIIADTDTISPQSVNVVLLNTVVYTGGTI